MTNSHNFDTPDQHLNCPDMSFIVRNATGTNQEIEIPTGDLLLFSFLKIRF